MSKAPGSTRAVPAVRPRRIPPFRRCCCFPASSTTLRPVRPQRPTLDLRISQACSRSRSLRPRVRYSCCACVGEAAPGGGAVAGAKAPNFVMKAFASASDNVQVGFGRRCRVRLLSWRPPCPVLISEGGGNSEPDDRPIQGPGRHRGVSSVGHEAVSDDATHS